MEFTMLNSMPGHPQSFFEEGAAVLLAMANKNRICLINLLLDGELSVGDLAQEIGISQSALSQHLAVLRRAKLVVTRRVAQRVYYSLASQTAKKILDVLAHTGKLGPSSQTPNAKNIAQTA
jgi:DNA-binding transcriptional ArsR family regulator